MDSRVSNLHEILVTNVVDFFCAQDLYVKYRSLAVIESTKGDHRCCRSGYFERHERDTQGSNGEVSASVHKTMHEISCNSKYKWGGELGPARFAYQLYD